MSWGTLGAGMSFPQITPADQARVHHKLLQQLGLESVHAVIGCR